MSAVFIIGRSSETDLPVHVQNAKNGLSCNCVCYKCSERLEAVQGKRDWHFRHSNKSNCLGSVETALHQFAKLLLYASTSIETKKKIIHFTDPRLETVIDEYRSDVCVTYDNAKLHFEVVVYHDLEPRKRAYYQSNGINCIKIDLSNPDLLTAQPEQIRNAVIQDKGNKEFIHWNEDKVTEKHQTSSENNKWLFGLGIFIGSLFLFRNSIFGGSKNRRRYRRSPK